MAGKQHSRHVASIPIDGGAETSSVHVSNGRVDLYHHLRTMSPKEARSVAAALCVAADEIERDELLAARRRGRP
jgi:hypothetical protein